MQWPGLNGPVTQGHQVLTYKQLPPNPEYYQNLISMRDKASQIRHPSIPPLLRGWSGARFPGQSVGPPDPIGDCT